MAAAVIEALFYGNDDVRLRAGPGRGRDLVLRRPEPERADALPAAWRRPRSSRSTDLVTIEPPFAKPQLEPGKVYFLNTQKLSKTLAADPWARRGDDDDVLDDDDRRGAARTCRAGRSGRRSPTRSTTTTSPST